MLRLSGREQRGQREVESECSDLGYIMNRLSEATRPFSGFPRQKPEVLALLQLSELMCQRWGILVALGDRSPPKGDLE